VLGGVLQWIATVQPDQTTDFLFFPPSLFNFPTELTGFSHWAYVGFSHWAYRFSHWAYVSFPSELTGFSHWAYVGFSLWANRFFPLSLHGFFHWAYKRWGDGERPRRMATDKCIVWMWLNECMYVIKYENKQKEWHAATRPLTFKFSELFPLYEVFFQLLLHNKLG
jgi:hypothetical protein